MIRFIFILAISINLFAVTIDRKWFDANNTVLSQHYNQQLTKIQTNLKAPDLTEEQKEQLEYQKILVEKLDMTLKKNVLSEYKNVKKIDSQNTFISEMKEYKTIQDKYTQIVQNSLQYQKKAQTLEDQISNADENEITTLNGQLLYAYYQLEIKNSKAFVKQVGKFFDDDKKQFLEALKKINFSDNNKLKEKIDQTNLKIQDIVLEQKKALLAFDKAQIVQNEKQIKLLSDKLELLKKQKDKYSMQLLWLSVEELLPLLKANESSLYFQKLKQFNTLVETTQLNFNSIQELLKYLSREYIGLTKTTLSDTQESFLDIAKFSWQKFNEPYIPLGKGISLFGIVQFFLIFIIGFSIASFYRVRILKSSRYNTSIGTRTMLSKIGYYLLVSMTFIIALKTIGLDLSSLTILVGALSVGIGFGLQNIVSNFISGIILLFEKSIQVGNIIEIDATLRGRVTQINMRSSVITTFDNIDIIIPNSTLMQNNVTNLTLTDDIRRLKIPFGIAYGSDIDHVIDIILEALNESDLVYIKNDKEKEPTIWMSAMGASSLDMVLLVWIHANTNTEGKDASKVSDFLIFIYKTLGEHNIEIPFPQMDVHLQKN